MTEETKDRVRELQDWLVRVVAETLEVPAFEIDVDAPFERYGMDSSAAVHIVAGLEKQMGRRLPPNLVYQHRTISALARHLATLPVVER